MREKFSAVVPVAGTGTRLKPHTNTYPKVLLTVGGKPILGHILDQLIEIGTPEIFLIVGYLGDKIRQYVAAKYPGLKVTYVEQKEPRGLGHAISLTEGVVKGPVFILLGDTILSADLTKFIDFSEDKIGVKEVEDPKRFGVVEVENGYVVRMVEKPENPPSNLAIVGAYSFRDSAALYKSLNDLIASGKTTKGEIQFTDALMAMVAAGKKIKPVRIDGWYDCGKPETLLATNRYLLDRKNRETGQSCQSGFLIRPPVYIAPTARVVNSVIGPYVSVCDGSVIENSIISDSIINENAELKNIILSDSLIGPCSILKGQRQHINLGENSEIFMGDISDN